MDIAHREIPVSFVHALQDIAMNVHGALCVTFPVEYGLYSSFDYHDIYIDKLLKVASKRWDKKLNVTQLYDTFPIEPCVHQGSFVYAPSQ